MFKEVKVIGRSDAEYRVNENRATGRFTIEFNWHPGNRQSETTAIGRSKGYKTLEEAIKVIKRDARRYKAAVAA